ncbi:MAG: hypothetical protein MUE69_22945 [Myxococcota bacterium]|jgi:hypothetical protein|nr:hypothetical protein [Myxococcota bacterium]
MPLSRVPQFREDLAFASIVAGAPVASTDWQRAAAVQNWVAGRGRQVIPTFCPDVPDLEAPSNTYRFALYVLPSYPTIDLVAMVSRSDVVSVLPGVVQTPSPVALSASPRSSYGTTAIQVQLDVAVDVRDEEIHSIAVYEIPRARIEQTASAGGIDTSALGAGQPITIASVDALRDAVADDTFGARVLAAHAVPWSKDGGSTSSTEYATASTSATYAAVVGGSGVPVLARKKRTTDTTRTVKARCYGWVTGATTGQFRVTSSSQGSSSAVSFTNTTPAWSSEITDLLVDCEDLSTATGLQSATWDELTVESRRSAGAGNVYVAGWIVYE